VLEYLDGAGRQAGAIAFLEVKNDWIPLGVWRFRELAREAMKAVPQTFDTLEKASRLTGVPLFANPAMAEGQQPVPVYARAAAADRLLLILRGLTVQPFYPPAVRECI
jgi:hypothetical protein